MTTTYLNNLTTNGHGSAPALNGQSGSLLNVLNWCLVSNLGWTMPFSGTNTAVYRQPAGSNGFYLNVNDNNTNNAQVTGYETMTAVATGTNPFPPPSTVVGGSYINKSGSADATSRPWHFFSNGNIFYLLVGQDGIAATQLFQTYSSVLCFGDFLSYKTGDAYNTICWADNVANDYGQGCIFNSYTSGWQYTSVWTPICRANTQIGVCINGAHWTDQMGGATYNMGAGMLPYPSPVDGGINIAKIYVGENVGRRGILPGVWNWQHAWNAAGVTAFTFAGTGALAGRTFISVPCNPLNYVFETSSTWSY